MLSSIHIVLLYSCRYNLSIFYDNLKYVSYNFCWSANQSFFISVHSVQSTFLGILRNKKEEPCYLRNYNLFQRKRLKLKEKVNYKICTLKRDHKPRRLLQMVSAEGVLKTEVTRWRCSKKTIYAGLSHTSVPLYLCFLCLTSFPTTLYPQLIYMLHDYCFFLKSFQTWHLVPRKRIFCVSPISNKLARFDNVGMN